MDAYEVTSDPARIPRETVHKALLRMHSCHAPSAEVFAAAFVNSVHFAVLTARGELAAYARLITDKATFAHLCDVFVLPEHRGQHLSRKIIEAVFAHPELQSIRQLTHVDNESKPFFQHSGFASTPIQEPVLAILRPQQ